MARTVTVSSPAMPSLLGGPALEFKRIHGLESVGSLFIYTIELQTPDSPALTEVVTANVPIKQLVGKELGISIQLDGSGAQALGAGAREINGLVTRARFVRSENRRSIYEVEIEPWLTLATRTSDYRIFQDKTVMEIVQEVLDDYGYPVDVKVSHRYPPRTFQVQYGETDFGFISRLMQEWGIYYFWHHEAGAHRLVLVDDAGAHKPFDSAAYEVVNFYGEGAKIDEEYCNSFDVADALAAGQWVTDDFDFTRPRANLRKTHKMPRDTGHNKQEVYRWPGDYADPAEGEHLARIRMEETGSRGKRGGGSGNLRAMVPGCTFTLDNHPQDTSNREWLILEASIDLSEAGHASGEEAYECHTRFQVQPANDTYRSPQRHPKPRTTGPQTAIVTGPPGQEIWTNEYGQVKVSFHWNRYCTKDENSSCWIRVSSAWAGSNFGAIAIPRIGQEVIVDFLSGDPDLPLVTGRVWNALNMPPWPLPGNATQSGVLTRSSRDGAPGAGMKNDPGDANALRFEDRKGQEQLWLHAQKDQLTEVENDEDKWVGNDRRKTVDRDETNVVHRDRTETVDRNEKITVHGWRTEEVDGDETITIHSNRTERVDHDERIDIGDSRDKTIGKNETDRIGKNWSINVGQMKTQTVGVGYVQNTGVFQMKNIGVAYSRNVGLAMMSTVGLTRTDLVGRNWSRSIGNDSSATIGGNDSLRVGKNQSIEVGGDHALRITGSSAIQSGQELALGAGVKLTADGQTVIVTGVSNIRLQCGASVINMLPGVIEITAPLVKINS